LADEIDDLIAKSGKLRSAHVDSPEEVPASPKGLDPSLLPTLSSVKEVDSVRAALRRLRWRETRLGAALRGAIFGSVVVVLYLGLAGVYSSEPFFLSSSRFWQLRGQS
jgi:hypothetical protein